MTDNDSRSLVQISQEWYESENTNCSETLLHACNDKYGLNISDDDFKLMAGFGGGMYTGNVCGALTGCVAALSKMMVQTKAHETPELREAVVSLNRNFRNILGDTQCSKIKLNFFDPDKRCLNTVVAGAQAMEQTVAELQEKGLL